jgi:RNA polymerase sigma-70 factor (ECF subfamily)
VTAPSQRLTYEQSDRGSEPESDSVLIQQCLSGHPHSFRQLYQRHQQRVRSLLFQLCGAPHLDDLVQEVFLRAWKGLPKLQQPHTFSTWLYRIAWNVASDQRRDLAKGRDHLQVITAQTPTQHHDRGLLELHYQDLVQRGLAHLSLEHRTVVVLHDLESVPQKTIAEILDIPVGTVKSRLFHARGALRQFLQQAGVQL